jgi:5-formyltetrahydrofolate cyclo-ligase
LASLASQSPDPPAELRDRIDSVSITHSYGDSACCQLPIAWITVSAVKTKDAIRQEVWTLMQREKVARFPGAEGRIPNFIGAEKCAKILAQAPVWKNAKAIKVNPDSPQRAVRQKALEEGKVIYMAVPRLHEPKPFIELDPRKLKASPYNASSIKGAFKYGRPVALDEVKKIDLVVCGSVAVNRSGARLGKGGGYSDLEFALLREEGKITDQTPIVTTVHPLQILDTDLPMTEHDIPLNAIVTPDEMIDLKSRYLKPKGIYWPLLPAEKIEAIPVLMARKETKKRRTQKKK